MYFISEQNQLYTGNTWQRPLKKLNFIYQKIKSHFIVSDSHSILKHAWNQSSNICFNIVVTVLYEVYIAYL